MRFNLSYSRLSMHAPRLLATASATLAVSGAALASQEVLTFAGNAQHTNNYPGGSQRLNRIKWQKSNDENNTGAAAHYGSPLVTSNDKVFVPVKITGNGFRVDRFVGATGTNDASFASDYILPTFGWIPVFQPVITTGPLGKRLYYAGAGGTIYYVDNPESAAPGAPTRLVFYTNLADYMLNSAAFNSSIFVNTPITADSNGTIFFGFRVQGTAPAPLNTTSSGFARIDKNGNASYVLAANTTGDTAINRVSHNGAPTLSADEQTLYVTVKWSTNAYNGYLIGLDTTNLTTKYKVFLKDPRGANAGILDDSTSSPVIAPDGDVYLGIFGNPYNGSRGFLLRFTADLLIEKTPGAFGWDQTPAIIPSGMVPSYTGSSSYLIFSKYNNYAISDGDGVNRIALLDPNETQIDPHPSAPNLVEMREVLTVIGPTRDNQGAGYPLAVREWCINASAVDVDNNSIIVPCEDGYVYRWDLSKNSLTEAIRLNQGLGQPYVPTIIGPTGTIYTLNGGNVFAIGGYDEDLSVSMTSSAPNMRTVVQGDTVTFTAKVSNKAPGEGVTIAPTGTVTFMDERMNGLTQENVPLGTVPLVDGLAQFTTSTLQAGGTYLGDHIITAEYSGDSNYPPGRAGLHQKVHQHATTTVVSGSSTSNFGDPVTFTATVATVPPGAATPTGMVNFRVDGGSVHQVAIDGSGQATFITEGDELPGPHTVTAEYASDTHRASSSGNLSHDIAGTTTTTLFSTSVPTTCDGEPVTIVAQVSSGGGTPVGSVTFKDGAKVLGSAAVDQDGNAEVTTTEISIGNRVITMEFDGTSPWTDSSETFNFTVTQLLSGFTLDSSSVPGGNKIVGTITILEAAHDGGPVIKLTDNTSAILTEGMPNLTIPDGETSLSFEIPTASVTSPATRQIYANIVNGSGHKITGIVNLYVVKLVDTFVASQAFGGDNGSGSVTIDGAKPTDVKVDLSDNTSAITVPASVTVPAGSTSAPFTFTTTAVSTISVRQISAKLGSVTMTKSITLSPGVLVSLTITPSTVRGGVSTTGKVTLNGNPAADRTATLNDNSSAIGTPPSATVHPGSNFANFTLTTTYVSATATRLVYATIGSVTKTASLTLTRAPRLAALTLTPSTVQGGQEVMGKVTLDIVSDTDEAMTVTSTSGAIQAPGTVHVGAGSLFEEFTIPTSPVSATYVRQVKAVHGSITKTANLTLTP